jgi:Na+/H+ antiporter NhaC
MSARNLTLVLLFVFSTQLLSVAQESADPSTPETEQTPGISYNVDFQKIIIQNIPVTITLTPEGKKVVLHPVKVSLNDSVFVLNPDGNSYSFKYSFSKKEEVTIKAGSTVYERPVNPVPLWMSIIPPLIAILMALLFREVYSALFMGLLAGTTILYFYQGKSLFIAIFSGLYSIIDSYIVKSMSDTGHISIILFSMMIGGMVTLITKNGGMKGIVNYLARYAANDKSGQFVTWLLGIAIFFDDYANTLIVGNTMRPVTDKLKISREKLAYIVDSTAAPVAALALTTTWIGIEIAYIQEGINAIGINESAYIIFIKSLTTRFYPILTLIFILILIFKGRDFGPMLKAERRARAKEIVAEADDIEISAEITDRIDSKKVRWYNAAIPVLVVVFGTFAGLVITGWNRQVWDNPDLSAFTKFTEIIGNSDSYIALLWASLSGMLVAVILTVAQRIYNLKKSIIYLIEGFGTMLSAVLILILAWSLALITQDMHTAEFLAGVLTDMNLTPFLLPAITFILSALIAFSTGSSWGTMAILYPLILPVSWAISQQYGMDYDASLAIFNNVVSSILAGSVFGDHCSPISDTTILSSLASSCNHIEHVRTQLPYAVTVGLVSVVFGTLPAAYGVPYYILYPANILILYLIVVLLGKKVNMAVE